MSVMFYLNKEFKMFLSKLPNFFIYTVFFFVHLSLDVDNCQVLAVCCYVQKSWLQCKRPYPPLMFCGDCEGGTPFCGMRGCNIFDKLIS